VGIDLSKSFIRAARQMQRNGAIKLSYLVEGERRASTTLLRPAGSHPERITFRTGDAMRLPASLTGFDVIVLLNLIDRVPDPARCLIDLTGRLNPGGQLIIASPYTWMELYTPNNKWLGGRGNQTTLDALKELLGGTLRLHRRRQIPFIIREHARKYQWSVAEGTSWIKPANRA
jgi:SAM-dependent methyltransferase